MSAYVFMSAKREKDEQREEPSVAGESWMNPAPASDDEQESDAGGDFDDWKRSAVDESQLEPRMSLWSVPAKWGGAFFVLLVVQGGVLIGLHVWRSLVLSPDTHVVDTVLNEVLVATPILVFAGILSMIELEGALTLSAWFEWWRIRKEKERYAAGFKDGKIRGEMQGEKRGEIRGEKRGEIRGEKRGWEKGIEEGRRLEREKVMAELASKSNGDVNND